MTRTKNEDGRLPRPLTGGYYWFPTPARNTVEWSVLTCHDLGFGPEKGHFDMWPSVIDRLATVWVRDAVRLRKLLAFSCYGLPRGRIHRPDGRFVLVHGDDAPLADWLPRVVERFGLEGRKVRLLYDEDKETDTEHRRVVDAEFGLSAGLSRPEEGEAPG